MYNYIFSTILIKCQIENPLRISWLFIYLYGILNDIEVDGEVSRLLPYLMWRKIITYGWGILNRAFSNAFKQAALLKDVIVILIDISFYAKVYGFDSDHKNQNHLSS